jgi:hypothetical protein
METALELQAAWDIFTKILWPLLLAYGAYLHARLNQIMNKFDRLYEEHHQFKTEAARDFATQSTVSALETKITRMLDRIDDKVTKILENRNA